MKNKAYGKMNISEFKMDNGLDVAVVSDRKISGTVSSMIVNAGLFEPDGLTLDGVKINGVVALVMAKAFKYTPIGNYDQIAFQFGELWETEVTNSKTIIKLRSREDPPKWINAFLASFGSFNVNKSFLEKAKQEAIFDIEKRFEDENFITELKMANALFSDFNQFEIIAHYRKMIDAVTVTILRKFFSKYYASQNMSLFVMGNVEEEMVRGVLKQVHLDSVKYKSLETEQNDYEDYSKANKSSCSIDVNRPYSRVVFGYKFPRRKDLYKKFQNGVFFTYPYLSEIAFGSESAFVKKAMDKGYITRVEDIDILEINEKTMLFGNIITFEPDKLIALFKSSKLVTRNPSGQAFKKMAESRKVEIQKNSRNIEYVRNLYISAHSNNIKLSEYIESTCELSKSKLKDFLTDMKDYPYTIYLERGKK